MASGEFPAFGGLVDHLGIERDDAVGPEAFALVEGEQGLELRPPGEFDRAGIRAVFPPDRATSAEAGRSALAKAFGKRTTRILDLTAGLGSDAYRLAAAGYEVHAWERHPVIFALLTSGWGQAVAKGRVEAELTSRLSFRWGEGATALADHPSLGVGAYFDPMYPAPKRSSALPKRPLQVLRRLLGDEEDATALAPVVDRAREQLARVVVKRPHHAPALVQGPNHRIESKLVRFDVYVNPARMEAADS